MDNKGTFARNVTRQTAQKQLGTAWYFSFVRRVREGVGSSSVVKYPGHAIGTFSTSEEVNDASPLVVFDPNAGVYRVLKGAERRFFDQLEEIYGQGNAVQLGHSAIVKLFETPIDSTSQT